MTEQSNEKANADVAKQFAAQRIISLFGGIRPMAAKLGIAVSTVQGWRERGSIPANRHGQIQAAAKESGMDIDPAELAASEHHPEASSPATQAPAIQAAVIQSAATQAAAPKAQPKPPPAKPEDKPADKKAEKSMGSTGSVKPPRASRGVGGAWLRGFLLGVLALGLGLGAAVIARDIWMPFIDRELGVVDGGAVDGGALQAMQRRIDELESNAAEPVAQGAKGVDIEPLAARLAVLESRLEELAAAPPASGDGDGENAARLAVLETRIETLASVEQRLGELPDLAGRIDETAGRIDGLDARIGKLASLEESVSALAGSRAGEAALALAVLQLRDALRGSGPFVAELALIGDLAASGALGDGAALNQLAAPLAPHAETGLPTLALLQASFPAAARAAFAQAQGGADGGWIAGILRRLSALITIRPLGLVEGQSAGAIVARAETYLMAGDLAAALSELDGLSGPAAEAVRSWREKAAGRLAARRTLTGLGQLLIGRLGQESRGDG